MKIKNLQINVLALLFGLTAVCFVNKIDASNATKSPEGEQFFDQNGDNSPNQNQKPTKQGNATETLNWTFRGPDDASGKVTSVVSNSSNYQIVYVGAAHNGVWKSTTGGGGGQNSWSKIPVEPNKNLYVTCLALDETNNILYAGTGGDFTGQGIYKSEGDGALKLMSGTESWTHVSKIAVSGNRVYAATDSGLMCYTGGSWKTCTGTKSGAPVTLDGPIRDMSINSAGLVIVAMNKVECYISKKGSPDEFEYKDLGITKYTEDNISVATSPTDNDVLYVVAAKLVPDPGKVFKAFLSEEQGDTWEVILTSESNSYFIDPLDGNGTNINNIYVDPVDPYTLYIASKNIWKGTRYAGTYDFGLSAISSYDWPTSHWKYLHSNVRSINFFAAADNERVAYVATDGGLYRVYMNISLYGQYTYTDPLHKFLLIGSYDHVAANNKAEILLGTPTLGVQAMDTFTNYATSARPVWDILPAAKEEISEGSGGACAISSINEHFYAYSLLSYDELTLTFRRSIDNGKSFHPMKNSTPTIEWFSSDMLPPTTPAPKYDAPMVMWESFDDDYTHDTVWFKANKNMNFYEGDRTIYAPSKNFNYPIEYTVPYGFTHGDSILVPDPVQNRMFVGLNHKLFMTREALDYEKTNDTTNRKKAIEWMQFLPALSASDTIHVLALSDNANTLYAGTVLGNVYCYTNLKQVHNTATVGLAERTLAYAFTGNNIRAMAVDPTDDNHLVVVLEGGGDNIYETYNGKTESATFNAIKGDLPNNVYSVLLPKGAKKGTIMAGTEKGIWTKEASGAWEANSKGMGEIPIMTLTQMTTYRPGVRNVPYLDPDKGKIRIDYPNNSKSYLTIYAGTYGSGVFSTEQYVGIEEFPSNDTKESDALTVIPNPVTDLATIELDMTKGQATIQVFSVDGRCIKEQTARNNINTINFKEYAPGAYIIQVTQGGAVKSAKVIKQ